MNKSLNEKLIDLINDIAENVFLVQFVISTIGLVLNIPHLLILLHNSMRTSSTNSIMIGVAICDSITLSQNVYDRVQGYWFYGSLNSCMNQDNYWYMYSLLIGEFLLTVFERASFWLGVFLALIRLVIMKKAGTTLKIFEPLYGYLLVLFLVCLSSAHSLYFYRGYSMAQWGTWKPEETCTGYPANYSEPAVTRDFAGDKILILKRYLIINGVSRILVSVFYPILTIMLIFVIRKSTMSKALNSRNYEERHRTCRLILVMSIFYVIASAPSGVSEYVQLFVDIQSNSILELLVGYGSIFISVLFCLNASLHEYVALFVTVEPNSVLETFLGYGSIFISALFCLNASSHGIINFIMSSNYRKTVKKCLGMEKPLPQ